MNTTTWIFDFKDKLSAPIKQAQAVVSDAINGIKNSSKEATNSFSKISESFKKSIGNFNIPDFIEPLKNKIKASTTYFSEIGSSISGILKDTLMPALSGGGITVIAAGITSLAASFGLFSKSIKDTADSYKKYEEDLAENIGTEQASDSMIMLKNISQDMPFAFNDIADSFTNLSSMGIKPTKSEMEGLGNLAAKLKIELNELTDADMAAQGGRFEQLQKIGIQAEKSGDKVLMSFRGVNKEIANTPEAIHNAIMSFGQMDGVKGAMSSMLNEVSGAKNKMYNHLDALKLKIAESLEPAFNIAKNIMVKIIDKITAVIDFIKTHWEPISTILKSFAIGVGLISAALVIMNINAIIAAVSTAILNAVLLISPFGIIAGLITGVGFALLSLWNKFEGFRAFVYSLWGVIKTVFASMWDVVKNFFGGLADMIGAILTGDWSGFKEGAKKFGEGLAGVTPVGFAIKYGGDIVNAGEKGWQNGKDSFNKKDETPTKSLLDIIPERDKKKPMATLPTGNDSKHKSGNGGAENKIRNVTVTIKQLIGSININSTTVSQSLGNVKQQVVETIVAAVRDSEIAIAQ